MSKETLLYSDVKINADELRDVVKKFERRLKSGRVFFPEDVAFAMKYEMLMKAAASGLDGLSVVDKSFTATDRTLYAEGDHPKPVSVEEEDIIALFDNTKKGLFGDLTKKPCLQGALITKKGFLVYNGNGKKVFNSGFVTWLAIARTPHNDLYETEFEVFPGRIRPNRPYPRGPEVLMGFWNFSSPKALEHCLYEMRLHLVDIARGKGNVFNCGDHMTETAEEAEEED